MCPYQNYWLTNGQIADHLKSKHKEMHSVQCPGDFLAKLPLNMHQYCVTALGTEILMKGKYFNHFQSIDLYIIIRDFTQDHVFICFLLKTIKYNRWSFPGTVHARNIKIRTKQLWQLWVLSPNCEGSSQGNRTNLSAIHHQFGTKLMNEINQPITGGPPCG